MNTLSKILVAIASVMLVVLYFVPLWQVSMTAPQYPEGIGIHIWVNQITGMKPNNLESINILNHYIGMKAIVPDAIPELRIMPFIVAFFVVSGLAVAFIGKRSFLALWVVLLVAIAVVGMYDYYLWGYDYGHNLSPDAAIKITGMAYQPPLIGTKTLLNFTATSLPHIGGYILALSILLGAAAWYVDVKKSVRS